MKYLFHLLFLFIPFAKTLAQSNCKPTAEVSVRMCGSMTKKDSSCPACNDCFVRLIAADSDYKIVSFIISAGGAGFDDSIEEAFNDGAFFTNPNARLIFSKLRTGSWVEFSCIKAIYKNGRSYFLKPLFSQL